VELGTLIQLLRGRRVVALTGAGCSTESGIPDYRGPDTPPRSRPPIQHRVEKPEMRQRYWARSLMGWPRLAGARPNAGHRALAELEQRGLSTGVITQNVDGLHLRAGSRHVVDIHGSMDRVKCLNCGQRFARVDIAERMAAANPWLDSPEGVRLNPDGDVDVDAVDDMIVPSCSVCGGVLKPEVVFFGEFVPTEKFAEASALVRSADALLIAGSSLVVNSGIRLLDQASKRRIPIVIVNRGATKGDVRAALKIEAATSEVLSALAERLS